MYFTNIALQPQLATLKAELLALRASVPAVLHSAIDARLDIISKAEAAIP